MNPIRKLSVALALLAIVGLGIQPASLYAQDAADAGQAQTTPRAATKPGAKAPPLEVYVHTLAHRDPVVAAGIIGHKLTPRGTVEVQPAARTVVVRDIASVLERVKVALNEFDRPPAKMRLEIRVVKAGNQSVISPPPAPSDDDLPKELLARLQGRLRYASYDVLAKAALTSLEGESVDYSLGPDYSVSFHLGSLIGGRTLQFKDFRVVERLASDKGRGVSPRQLFRGDLNVSLDRPFALLLAQDEDHKEALLIALTGRVEPSESPESSDR